MGKILITVILSILGFISVAQYESGVTIIQDSRIDTLLQKHVYLNELEPDIEGWRVQIFFEAGNYSKRIAIQVKSEFVAKYQDVPVYLIFQEPYYKVRIGDYRTRMDAEKFLNKINHQYPNAFVVSDEINFPGLD